MEYYEKNYDLSIFEKDYVRRGWQECIDLGINREQHPTSKLMDKDNVRKLLKEKKYLIEVAKPFLRELFSFVNNSGFSVTLTDENGCLLDYVGDKNIIEDSVNKQNFVLGSFWIPTCLGNTATYTSLVERKPVQLVGNEHYLYDYQDWTCSSSPIIIDDKLIGAISMKGYSIHTHIHTLGMVVAAAKAIEHQLIIIEKNNQIKNNQKYQLAVSEFIDSGFISIDNNGFIKFLNKAGADIFKVNPEDYIGNHIDNIYDKNSDLLNVLNTGCGYENKEYIKYDKKNKIIVHLVKTANPIFDENKKIIGAIEKFSKFKTINNMIKSLVGNYGKFTFDDIITNDSSMQDSIGMAKKAAKSNSKVIIYGESGTGKELFVQSIHNASERSSESFIALNCSAIPNELIESELFGYEPGSFTGASKERHLGKFELANGGTLFLDEIGDMPLHMQVKVLRCIQNNQITRLGSSDTIDLDVRIICATNKNLVEECKRGNFREDLYYRLNVLSIYIPPLRNRKGDIKLLANHFIGKMNYKIGKNIKSISNNALKLLESYNWPGNVRELENIVERAVNLCDSDEIDIIDLPHNIICDKTIVKEVNLLNHTKINLRDAELDILVATLNSTNGNISKTAKQLGVSRNTIYEKIKKYNIPIQDIK